jgi:hypothetical protein
MYVKHSLKELLLEELSLGPKNNKDLVLSVASFSKTSPQGVYKALRALKKEERVVIHNHVSSISSTWLFHEQEKLMRIQKTYALKEKLFTPAHENKESSIKLRFKTLDELDLFWTHAFMSLEESTTSQEVSISIAPHDWFFYSRKETDSAWIHKHNQKNRKAWVILTHPTKLDKEVIKHRKAQSGDFLTHYYGNPLLKDETTYLNILGSYVFKVKLDLQISKKLNSFIANHHNLPLNKTEKEELGEILRATGSHEIVIYNSPKKAEKIRKRISTFFI